MNNERAMDSAELYALAIEAGGQLLGPQQRLWLDRLGENRERLPAPLSPLHGRAVADLLGEIRAALGDEGFAASWREGQDAGDLVLERLAGGLEEQTPSQPR